MKHAGAPASRNNATLWLWVPAFAGTTAILRRCVASRGPRFPAPAAEIPQRSQADLGCPVPQAKINRFSFSEIHAITASPRAPGGRIASRQRYVGRGLRWPLAASGDFTGRNARRRTAKPCGPGAATVASSWREVSRRRRWQQTPLTGESTV
jgi:hypothetical protein